MSAPSTPEPTRTSAASKSNLRADPEADGPRRSVAIMSSSWGGGHMMVAETVRDAVLALRPSWQVEVLDFFERFVGRRFSRSVASSYLHSVKAAPFLYDIFYRATQRVGERSRLQARLNTLGRERLYAYLRRKSPDVVVSTYPTPAGVLSALKQAGKVDTRSVTILTDYAIHSQWMHRGVDLHIVGSEAVRQGLIDWGLPDDCVLATGIPIRSCFAEPHPPRPPDGPVLVMVGAVGMLRGADRLCRALAEAAGQLVVVCGKDEKLRQKLLAMEAAGNGRLEVHGFVDGICALMAKARLLVTKPGGVTVSEALAMGLPMVVYGAIPGQEEENERFLVSAGAARAPKTIPELCGDVARLLRDPQRLAAMAERAAALGRPNSARDAAEAVVRLLEGDGDRAGD